MRIVVMQGYSQKEKNALLYEAVQNAAAGHEVINLGVFAEEETHVSYLQTAILASLALNLGAADFAVTGCSSGQGMALAMNCFPGVLCGYLPTPEDAYLFGRINDGNAASLPLGLGFGWAGELRLRHTLGALFGTPFGTGYPPEESERKRRENAHLKQLALSARKSWEEIIGTLDRELLAGVLMRRDALAFIRNGSADTERAEKLIRRMEESIL